MYSHIHNDTTHAVTQDTVESLAQAAFVFLLNCIAWVSMPEHWAIIRDVCVTLSAVASVLYTAYRWRRKSND